MGGYGSSYSYSSERSVSRRSASSYNVEFDRRYLEAKRGVPAPKEKILITESKFPVVVAVDVTGSMREYPKIIFEKLCMLYNEVMFFLPTDLKDGFEISFAAVGDATHDESPLQVTDFATGGDLDANINSIYPEGGGGASYDETYELLAYYYARKCEMPNALENPKPLLFFVSDEGFYNHVSKQHVKDLIGDEMENDLKSALVFGELANKFTVYNLRVRYGMERVNKIIEDQWKGVLGNDKVMLMEDPRRVVDIIIGIVASAVKEFDSFKDRLEVRQTPEQVTQVYKSLKDLGIE